MWHHTPIDTKLEHGVALVEPLPSEFMSEFYTLLISRHFLSFSFGIFYLGKSLSFSSIEVPLLTPFFTLI